MIAFAERVCLRALAGLTFDLTALAASVYVGRQGLDLAQLLWQSALEKSNDDPVWCL